MSPPAGLALHTTTGELGVCSIDRQGLYRQQSWDLGRELASQIQIKLAEFIPPLSWSELDLIAVANGPGSYTSTRIGVVTAKTLAQQLQIPVYGISTLMAIAWYYRQKLQPDQYLAVTIESHNDNIFGAIYQFLSLERELKVIVADAKFTPSQWQETIDREADKIGGQDKLVEIQAPDKIAFTAKSLLEIALLKYDRASSFDDYHWRYLDAFYE